MKTAALKVFRQKLADDVPTYGLWVTLESPSITEMAVALGLDWVVIDAEHGHLDWKEIVEHLRATVRSDTVALVGLTERDTCLSKRALDLGADGVVLPWINTAEQLEEAIRDCLYPPEGRRGIGGERATAWGQCFREHALEANENVLVVPKIESVEAIANVPEMARMDGVDFFFFGPADFSSTAGHRGLWQGPGVAEQLLAIKDTLRAAGKHVGIIATDFEDLRERREQGFRVIAVGTDVGLTLRSLHQGLAAAGRDRKLAPSLDAEEGQAVVAPLASPPEWMRPDRFESIGAIGEGERGEIQEGVACELLVGRSNSARGLSTGIVTLQPGAALDGHTHPCGESITVLEGQFEVSVEGRAYRLGPLDNVVIPRWLPHAGRNPSDSAAARLHVAWPMSVPEREPIAREFPRRSMAEDCLGSPGAERVTRHRTAPRYSAGAGTEFIDFFGAGSIPGIEMSGGYGRFDPRGRLPAHLHDFDESICVIRGTATCRVEGREYRLSDLATAMVPRGRVHYFANESSGPMAMIWVYAGPMPERFVVAEDCMTTEGCPWE
jgi:2-dehydro-3-deoxyglucarate aldolase/4-hydroxy-2-oxoheptanedioate aldolase